MSEVKEGKTAFEHEVDNCPLEPLKNMVVLSHNYDKERVSSSGMRLISDINEDSQRAMIIKTGPEVKDHKAGEEFLLFGMVNVTKIGGKEYIVLRDEQLTCKVLPCEQDKK